MRVDRAFVLVFATAVATGCGGGGGGGGGFINNNGQTIGPAGGTFTISQGTLAGTTVTVPAGAVAANTNFTVNPTAVQISAPNATNMGTTVTIGPAGTTFATPITITLPFPVSAVETGMTEDNVVVGLSGPNGLVEIFSTSANLSGGTVTFNTSALGDFVVAKRPLTRKFIVTSGAIAPSAGFTINPPITVSYQQENGTVVTSENITATAVLGVNPVTGSTLTGTTAKTPTAGVATFDNLVVSLAGAGYRMDFTSPGVKRASLSFSVTAAPGMLAFTGQPTNVVESAIMSPVTVQIQTTGGATATGFNGPVTLSLGANPNGGTLVGTVTVNAVNGVATFSNLAVNRPGTGYTLVANGGSFPAVGSAAFNVLTNGALGDGRIWAVSAVTSRLYSVDLRNPTEERSSVQITGLGVGETIDGMDFRPANGLLYAIASVGGANNRILTINTTTGAVTQIGATFALAGTQRGFDFNPVADRIRIVTDAGDNIRVNPDTGAVITPLDANLNGAATSASGAAYTNDFVGATTTTLYVINTGVSASLFIQGSNPFPPGTSPNTGMTTIVGAGLGPNVIDVLGFDIAPVSTAAYAALNVGGTTGLYQINLTSGTAAPLGAIGTTNVRAMALASTGFVGLTTGNTLVTFNASNARKILSAVPVSGLQAGENLLGIDYRPLNNLLYGLGSTSRLYTLDLATGVATQVGTGQFATLLSGTDFGFDFNPTVDRIRVTSNTGQNIRLFPHTGAIAGTDLPLAYGGSDPFFGTTPNVVASAYLNNNSAAATTILFAIDSNLDRLSTQIPPNNGTLNSLPNPLGFNVTADASMDITVDDLCFAAMRQTTGTTHQLFQLNCGTGVATIITDIDTQPIALRGLTSITPSAPRMYAVTTGSPPNLVTFNPATPGTTTTTPISGLQAGELILGIDFRPATRQLYALGSTSRLYIIDVTAGITPVLATQVGTAGAFTLNGTNFGFDFNPVVDRIRVTSDLRQNLRLNPNDGTLTSTDGMLTFAAGDPSLPSTPTIVASGYLNSFPGAQSTTLFGIDSALDILVTQNPPNNGTINTVGTGLGFNVDGNSNLEITTGGVTYGVFTVTAVTGLYTINRTTGAATLVGAIGGGGTPFAGVAYGP